MRDDEPCVLLIIGGDDVPRRMMSACSAKAILVNLRVVFPVFPLVNVRGAELPVLVGFVDPGKKSLPLLRARQVEKNLDDFGAVAMEVLLQVCN